MSPSRTFIRRFRRFTQRPWIHHQDTTAQSEADCRQQPIPQKIPLTQSTLVSLCLGGNLSRRLVLAGPPARLAEARRRRKLPSEGGSSSSSSSSNYPFDVPCSMFFSSHGSRRREETLTILLVREGWRVAVPDIYPQIPPIHAETLNSPPRHHGTKRGRLQATTHSTKNSVNSVHLGVFVSWW